MKEYKIALVWAIVVYVCTAILITAFSFCLLMPIIPGLENEVAGDVYWFMAALSVVMIALCVIAILDTIKGRFVIEKNRVYTIGAISKKELFFHEIKGYRIVDKFIFIEPKDKNAKKIKINNYFGKISEIREWLIANYPNVALIEEKEEKEEILSNQEFGWNKEEREQKLSQASKTAKVINILGGAIALWTLFFPKPYLYAALASIVFPIICIFIIKFFKGLIRINHRVNTAYPTAFFGLLSTVAAIFFKIYTRF